MSTQPINPESNEREAEQPSVVSEGESLIKSPLVRKYLAEQEARAATPAISPRFALTGRELLDIDVPKPVAIVDGLFFEGKDSIMGGHYGIGKTTASLHIGAGIAAGETVFGLRVTRPYRVLYLDLELGTSEFKERYIR